MNGSILQMISALRCGMSRAAERAGRRASEVQIVLVTKTVSAERVQEAAASGVLDFGENKVQEMLAKKKNLPAHLRWHIIGHLQTNKVRQVIGETALIHSLDRFELAEEIQRQAEKKGIEKVPCLVQVNISGETTKFGLSPVSLDSFVGEVQKFDRLDLRGMMVMGPWTEDQSAIRQVFREGRRYFEKIQNKHSELKWDTLSMGMSGDFEIAVEEGSTLVRIGTAVFGSRNQQSEG